VSALQDITQIRGHAATDMDWYLKKVENHLAIETSIIQIAEDENVALQKAQEKQADETQK